MSRRGVDCDVCGDYAMDTPGSRFDPAWGLLCKRCSDCIENGEDPREA